MVISASDSTDSNKDWEILVEALGEYSGKLKALCDKWERAKDRQQLMISTVILLVFVLSTFGFLWIRRVGISLDYQEIVLYLACAIGILAWLFVVWVSREIRLRRFARREITITSDQVAQLIRLASQVQEHRIKGYAEKMLFKLRIAEAEAALRISEFITRTDLSMGTLYEKPRDH
jgi:hypothetical protein